MSDAKKKEPVVIKKHTAIYHMVRNTKNMSVFEPTATEDPPVMSTPYVAKWFVNQARHIRITVETLED